MRLLHTADWHLGHSLNRHRRGYEHDRFLAWLLDQLVLHHVDALIVAGDVFDTANPPSQALRAWYAFVVEARQRCPGLDVVVIGGNHDSAARLDAPRPLLEAAGVHVIGGLPVAPDGACEADRLVVPLHDASGQVAAWALAVPFLRLADLPAGMAPAEGVRARYDEVAARLRTVRQPGQAVVTLGHAYMTGTHLSELSERKVLGGNQHALPTAVFPPESTYVALGHLHLAQEVGPAIHYPGSPLPLSFGERTYEHQVLLVEIEGERLLGTSALRVPRAVDLIAVPDGEHAAVDLVLEALAQLPDATEEGPDAVETWPYVEVRVRLDGPLPALRGRIERALSGKAARLVRIDTAYTGSGRSLFEGQEGPRRVLADLAPEEVLRERWKRDYDTEPDDALLKAFHEVVDQVHQGLNP